MSSAAARAPMELPKGWGDLTGFIQYSIQQGLSEDAIRRALVESGESEERIDQAFRKFFEIDSIPALPEEIQALLAEPTGSRKGTQEVPSQNALESLPEIEMEAQDRPNGEGNALRGAELARSLRAEPARPSHLVSNAALGRALLPESQEKVELQAQPGRVQRVKIHEPGTISLLMRRGSKQKSRKKKRHGRRGSGLLATATLLLGLGACAMIWSGMNPIKVARQLTKQKSKLQTQHKKQRIAPRPR